MKWVVTLFALLGVSLGAWAHWPAAGLPATVHVDKVVVKKSARVLELYDGEQLLRRYVVSLGSHPVGHKEQEGDGRTPEGQYVLDYRKADSSFHRALHISYPNSADYTHAGKMGVDAGGNIMVHGIRNGLGWLGRLHTLVDWTDGCVAVTDRDIEEIWRVVPDRTPIVLEP